MEKSGKSDCFNESGLPTVTQEQSGNLRCVKSERYGKKTSLNFCFFVSTVAAEIDPNCQGQILAVWILAAKLPNSDLNFALDCSVDYSSCFSKEKGPNK